jgi:hypothetical protein
MQKMIRYLLVACSINLSFQLYLHILSAESVTGGQALQEPAHMHAATDDCLRYLVVYVGLCMSCDRDSSPGDARLNCCVVCGYLR